MSRMNVQLVGLPQFGHNTGAAGANANAATAGVMPKASDTDKGGRSPSSPEGMVEAWAKYLVALGTYAVDEANATRTNTETGMELNGYLYRCHLEQERAAGFAWLPSGRNESRPTVTRLKSRSVGQRPLALPTSVRAALSTHYSTT